MAAALPRRNWLGPLSPSVSDAVSLTEGADGLPTPVRRTLRTLRWTSAVASTVRRRRAPRAGGDVTGATPPVTGCGFPGRDSAPAIVTGTDARAGRRRPGRVSGAVSRPDCHNRPCTSPVRSRTPSHQSRRAPLPSPANRPVTDSVRRVTGQVNRPLSDSRPTVTGDAASCGGPLTEAGGKGDEQRPEQLCQFLVSPLWRNRRHRSP